MTETFAAIRSPIRRRRDVGSHSRDRLCPRFAISFAPFQNKGRGEDRVRAAPAVSCAFDALENAHTSIQVQRKHSGLPCAMALRLIRALVSTLCHHHQRDAAHHVDLTPALGRQDHTISPYTSAPFVIGTSASTASRPAFRDDRERPFWWDGMARIIQTISVGSISISVN
jgi:hypothetical protein